jgi:cell division septation protein DedD
MTPVSTMPMNTSEDTEITLGTGKMLALFFGLVILCAVFFGMGFSMGKNSVRSAPELLPSPGTSTGVRPSASNRPANSQPAESKPTENQPAPAANDTNATNSAGQPAAASSDQQAAPQPVQPGSGYFVQVAAVSKQEDAEALVESLKGRQYSAFIVNPSPDKFFHVQVGPFTDIKDAESMRAKLVSDGYNPILKK